MTNSIETKTAEALERVIDFFSLPSSLVSNVEKQLYITEVAAAYSADAGLFSACLSAMLLKKDEALYHSVWPFVECK